LRIEGSERIKTKEKILLEKASKKKIGEFIEKLKQE